MKDNPYKHFLIFFVLSFQVILLSLYDWHFSWLIVIVLLGIRIITLKDKKIILLNAVFCFLAIGFFFMLKISNDVDDSQIVQDEFIVYPDSLSIDGDFLKGKAMSLTTKQTYLLQYQLKTEEEKNKLQQNTRPILLRASVSSQEPTPKRNLNGFDYSRYLDITGIRGVYRVEEVRGDSIQKLSLKHPILLLSSIRQSLSLFISETFHPVTSMYMDNLILGKQNHEIRDVWQELSLSHLFALSGVHVSFVILFVRHILLRFGLSKRVTGFFEIITICLFIALSGFAIGVIRAGLQETVKRLNKIRNWDFSSLDCFSLTLLIHSLFSPLLLLTIGGQLSYYLSFLIIFIQPRLVEVSKIKQVIYFQIILTFFSIPIICFYFYQWHMLSGILSLIVTPLLFQCMLPVLLISLIFGKLLPGLMIQSIENILIFCHAIPKYLSQFSIFKLVTGTFPLWLLVLIILCQFILFMYAENNKMSIKTFIICCVMCPFSLIFIKYLNPVGMIAVVDIGQGDAIFIQLPFNQGNYLIDTGGQLDFKKEAWQERSNKKSNAEYTLIPFLKSRGVSNLDTVFITHAHEDHFGDIDVLHQSIPIKQLISTTSTLGSSNVQQKIHPLNIKQLNSLSIPNRFEKQGMIIDALYPKMPTDAQNNDSLVLKVLLCGNSYLLTGDLEKEGEEELIGDKQLDLSADFLKVGHHGSKTSTTPEFLERVAPKEAFISCGVNNRFNHPSKETLDTLTDQNVLIYRTDEDGMIYQTWSYFGKNMSKTKTIR